MKKQQKTFEERQKAEALRRMRKLKLLKPVIEEFEESGKVYGSERQNRVFDAVLYDATCEDDMWEAIQKFEGEYKGCLVYHCQKTHYEFGDLISLLYVSKDEGEWEEDRRDLDEGYPFAYVDNGEFGEFGRIGIRPSMGGVVRTC